MLLMMKSSYRYISSAFVPAPKLNWSLFIILLTVLLFDKPCLSSSVAFLSLPTFAKVNTITMSKGTSKSETPRNNALSHAAKKNKAGVERISQSNDCHDCTISATASKPKRLILIRHGTSLGNEFMDTPGNRWGDDTFTDNATLIDSPLSEKGKIQAKSLREPLKDLLMNIQNENESLKDEDDGMKLLIVTSPLTRCIETLNIGVLPNIKSMDEINIITKSTDEVDGRKNVTRRVIVQPLATERVYTASDTGRFVEELKDEFPHLDFHSCFQNTNDKTWWYAHNDNHDKSESYEEWRPFGKGQYYAVPGEPVHIFNQRMIELFRWIKSREEETILLVTHWAVIRFLTGEEISNCGLKVLNVDELFLKDDIVKMSSL
mmetsp:Transcript_318/g.447  ORF Transcript_318/g.447 Transcript_318/m.447 type:complete len:376 (+) Transcript_318:33-1160(+)